MSLQFHDEPLPGVQVKKAYAKINDLHINPGVPIYERAKSTFKKEKYTEIEKNEVGEEIEVEKERKVEVLGEILSSFKTYNVVLFVHYSNEWNGEIYARDVVSIDGLLEHELTFPIFYKKLKEKEKFSGAEDV